jgi:uncharacterized OB-fold protein
VAARMPYVSYLELDPPHLVAQECTACGALFLDRRNGCARCGGREFGTRRLRDQGTVRAFTIVHRAPPGIPVPYASAVVDLDGGGTVKANLRDVAPTPEAVRLGMRVELATFVVGHDVEGTEGVAFGYRPAAENGSARHE